MALNPVDIIKVVVTTFSQPAINATKNWAEYVRKYEKNLKQLGDLRLDLVNKRKDIEQLVELGNRKNEVPVAEVVDWLKQVDELLDSNNENWEELLDKNVRKKAEKCCLGFCWSPKYRHDISKEAVEKCKAISDKIEAMNKRGQALVTLPQKHSLGGVKSIDFSEGLPSRVRLVEDILRDLKDDSVNRIGVHGAEGIGKTTLMFELIRRANNENLFNDIARAEISRSPVIKDIQAEIADYIQFPLDDYKSIEYRAHQLGVRLRGILNPRKPIENKKHVSFGDIRVEGENESQSIKEDSVDRKQDKQKESSDVVRKDREKNNKILLILDDMWEKIDLRRLGISHDLQNDFRCKIIVVSSREQVCKEMGATSKLYKVNDLSDIEAEYLFRERVGKMADDDTYKDISKELLNKCSRLPHAICALADTLKDGSLLVWKRALKSLDNPVEGENTRLLGTRYQIIQMTYNNLGNDEVKLFFLLCCLFPSGSSVYIYSVMKYGIAMGLFQYTNSLVEALYQAYDWTEELKSLSLFTDFDAKIGKIYISNDVQKAGKSFSNTEKHVFHVGTIPKWLKSESYNKFTAISVSLDNGHEHLQDKDLSNLQLLRCPLTCGSRLGENYFKCMQNLNVLDMYKSDIQVLPSSIGELKYLKTLLLDECSLKNISEICKLVNLQVLSLRKCNITTLPGEIGSLVQLKLLDLSNSNELKEIPVNTLVKLTQLEGLYMRNSFSEWEVIGGGGRMASLSELSSLPLNVLEMKVKSTKQLCDGDFPSLDLSSYVIQSVVSQPLQEKDFSFSHDLQIGDLHASALLKEGWKRLVNKVESLHLQRIQELENVAPYLSGDENAGLNELKSMKISYCTGMQYLVNTKGITHLQSFFPEIETLWLESIGDMKTICHGKCPPDLFSNLREIKMLSLSKLQHHALPFLHSPTRLRDLEVYSCSQLKYIFSSPMAKQYWALEETKESCEYYELPHLRILKLTYCGSLKGLCSGTNKGKQLFSKKVRLPSLDKLKAHHLYQVEELWDTATSEECFTTSPELRTIYLRFLSKLRHIWNDELSTRSLSFSSLKKLKIIACDSLETVCPFVVATGLHQLELLRIDWSDKVKQIISTKHVSDEDDNLSLEVVEFPKLLSLDLMRLPELTCFYKGRARMDGLLFNSQVKVPLLEQLRMRSLSKVKSLWESAPKFLRMFPSLKSLSLEDFYYNLKYVWNKDRSRKSHNFTNFNKITIESCYSLKSLYKSSRAISNYSIDIKFAELQTLTLIHLRSFKYLLKGNINLELPALINLKLTDLYKMKTFASLSKLKGRTGEDDEERDGALVPLFHPKISFPALEVLQLEMLPRVVKLWSVTTGEKLTNLQCANSIVEISIESCRSLKCLFSVRDATSFYQLQPPKVMSFPKLARLELVDLDNLRSMFQGIINLKFEALKILVVKRLPMIKTLIRPRNNVVESDDNDDDDESTKEEDNLEKEKSSSMKWDDDDDLDKDEPIWEDDVEECIKEDDDTDHIEEFIKEDEKADKEYLTEEDVDYPHKEESSDSDDDSDEEESYTAKPNEELDAVLFNGNVEFPSLEELTIEDVPELEHIYDIGDDQNANAGNSLFPRLRTLGLIDLSKLKQLPKQMSRRLSSLQIRGLHRLRYLFSSSNVYAWEKLEQLSVKYCDDMEAIVVNTEVQRQDFEFIFPELKKIELEEMPSLDSFCSASNTVKFPSLESLEMWSCYMVRSFSSTTLVAPKLSKVKVEGSDCSLDTNNDLNTILQNKFDSKHKYAKYWPRVIKHKLHEEHELKLIVLTKYYLCKGCNERGRNYTYRCGTCGFDFHPFCVLEESQITEDPNQLEEIKSMTQSLSAAPLFSTPYFRLRKSMGKIETDSDAFIIRRMNMGASALTS